MGKSLNWDLAKRLFDSHHHEGFGVDKYFDWLLDDCLAVFGRRIEAVPPEKARERISELAGLYAEEVIRAEPFDDVLGGIYMEISSRFKCKSMGQYFTPEPIARMMAEISFSIDDTKHLTSVCDPACGAGVMLLSCAKVALQRGNPLSKVGFYAVDLDGVCARMSALQLMANAFINRLDLGEVLVYHGNALGDCEAWVPVVHATHKGLPESEILPEFVHRERVSVAATEQAEQGRVLVKEDQLVLEL